MPSKTLKKTHSRMRNTGIRTATEHDVRHTMTEREMYLEKQVQMLTEHIIDIERRLTRLGLAKQPTNGSHPQGKTWGLPPKKGEIRINVRDDDFTSKELCWY